jgi:hypothetical protein
MIVTTFFYYYNNPPLSTMCAGNIAVQATSPNAAGEGPEYCSKKHGSKQYNSTGGLEVPRCVGM